MLATAAATGRRPLILGGQTFPAREAPIQQMELWSQTLPVEVYQQYLDEGATLLAGWSEATEESNTNILASYHELASRTRPDWAVYEKSSRYGMMWTKLKDAVPTRAANEAKRSRTQKAVETVWGSSGKGFMKINTAIQWSVKAVKLAQRVGDYDKAVLYLNRVLYMRRLRTDAGSHAI